MILLKAIVSIICCNVSREQVGDIFTKPLPKSTYKHLRSKLGVHLPVLSIWDMILNKHVQVEMMHTCTTLLPHWNTTDISLNLSLKITKSSTQDSSQSAIQICRSNATLEAE